MFQQLGVTAILETKTGTDGFQSSQYFRVVIAMVVTVVVGTIVLGIICAAVRYMYIQILTPHLNIRNDNVIE